MTDAETKSILDAIAAALHPHWKPGHRNAYLPEKLPGMVEALMTGNGHAHPWYGPCDGFAGGRCSECARVSALIRQMSDKIADAMTKLREIDQMPRYTDPALTAKINELRAILE